MSKSTTTAGAAMQTSKPTQAASTQSGVPQDKVAKRAYELWLKGGCKHGCDKQHWFAAEAEIRAEMTGTTAAKPAAATARR